MRLKLPGSRPNEGRLRKSGSTLAAVLWLLPAPAAGQSAEPPEFYAADPRLLGYVQEALEKNPALRESLARYRAALQRVPQVRSLPDPMLNYNQFFRSVETRTGPQLNSFAVSQKLPWFGKLDLQGRIAVQEASALYYEHRAQQRTLIAAVKSAYYELGYLAAAVDIARQERILLERYEQLSRSQYSQGRGPLRAVVRIQAELTRLDDRLVLLERQQRSQRARFNAFLDRSQGEAVDASRPPAPPDVDLDSDALTAMGRRHRPELKGAMERIEGRQQRVELSRKRGWPDVTLSAGFINVGDRRDPAGMLLPPPDNGKNAFSVSVGVNIPLWRDKYDSQVLEATESVIAGREAYRRLDNQMQFEVRDQVVRLEALDQQLELYDSLLLPQAEQTLRATESDFEVGRTGSFELLDSERFLLQVRLQRIRQQTDYLQGLTALERALGTRFPR